MKRLVMGLCLSAFVCLAAAGLARAADEDDEIDCNKATTQLDINSCAAKSFGAADQKLNEVYRRFRAKLAAPLPEKLKLAERAWVAFVRASADKAYDRYRGGSMAPMAFSMESTRVTEQRTAELTALERGESFADEKGCAVSDATCRQAHFQSADEALNKAYKKAMAGLDDDAARGKLRAAQKAWIAFRDANAAFHVEWAASRNATVDRDAVKLANEIRMTRERTKDLQDIIADDM